MASVIKETLLRNHSFLDLRLTRAAIGSFPIHQNDNFMAVNRLFVIVDEAGDDSFIKHYQSGEVLPIRKNCIYMVPCQHVIELKLTGDVQFVSLHFNLDLFYGFDVFKSYDRCVCIENSALVDELQQLMEQEDQLITLCRIDEIILGLCVSLLKTHPKPDTYNNKNWHKYESILDFVRDSGDALTTVTVLAEMNGMRRDVFSREFTQDMGINPKEFLDNTLMRKVTKMLLTSQLNSRQIADKLNFSSEHYFSRFFKRHTKMSPRAFKSKNS